MNNDIRNLSKWLNEEQETPIDRQALARVLAMADQPAHQHIEHCLWARNGNQPCPHVQPAQQEPVAWLHPANSTCVTTDPTAYARGIPLYTSPPSLSLAQRKPLTDEQIEQCMKQAYSTVRGRNLELAFARAIESAHGITKE